MTTRKSPLPMIISLLLAGCAPTSPFISKAKMGNLEINVSGPQGVDTSQVRIYVDGQFIGNASTRLPVLHVKTGERTVRAELNGFPPVEQRILIIGEPNHQVLNVLFKKDEAKQDGSTDRQ